jgi:3-phenylpropionate/trans-cinnamate dioxygenase ferredoxin reductase component
MQRVVVVGGSLGGLRAVENLRLQGFDGDVTVLAQEAHPPYTRPPLSKQLLTKTPGLADCEFRRRPEADLADWRFGTSAVACDLELRTVTQDDGEVVEYDGIIAATGVRSRRLPASVTDAGYYIRTLDDAIALQPRLVAGVRLVIVGAGFIGCEVAATAVRLGCEVDVVAQDPAPLFMPLGTELGAAVRRRHESNGVRFHLDRGVGAIGSGVDDTWDVTLTDGTVLGCDLFVVAVGSVPNTEWLEGNGLELDGGVVCDNWMRMGGRPAAVAIGDVARFPNPWFDDVPRRVEHWQMPTDTARRAVATLLADLAGAPADAAPFTPLPWFWSDQYGEKLQSFGFPGLGQAAEILEGSLTDEAVVAYRREGRLIGVVLLGMPRSAPSVRRLMLESLSTG